MKHILIIISFFIQSAQSQVTFAQNPNDFSTKKIEKLEAPKLSSLAAATQWADLVAIAQVDDIEYEKVRDLNAKGYAFLDILVAYKGASKNEPIAVLATGFDDNVCYYPDRINEGERFLVFLKKAPDELKNVYYGFKPFCQLQILLSEMGQYILRTPVDNNIINFDKDLIEQKKFNDPHAMIDSTLWTGIKRKAFAEQYQCKIIETDNTFDRSFHLRYTQGIPIYKVRPLLKLKHIPKITSKQI